MKRIYMDRFIDSIEWVAAAFVGIVAANIFVAVLLRNLFSYSIPDSYDIGRLMLGILIFWGIAATSYRGTHITVDLVWGNVGPRYQRMIDVFATLVHDSSVLRRNDLGSIAPINFIAVVLRGIVRRCDHDGCRTMEMTA